MGLQEVDLDHVLGLAERGLNRAEVPGAPAVGNTLDPVCTVLKAIDAELNHQR
jgi:hypothetical protein